MTRPNTSSRIGRLSGAILLASASVIGSAVILLLLEFVAGLLLHPPSKPNRAGSEDTVARTLANLDINPAPLVPDPELLWANLAGAHKVQPVNPRPFGQRPTWTIDNNSEGFRGPEVQSTKPTYRILCVGDSITFGFNVDQPDNYPSRLLEALHRRYSDTSFEVINAGVPGWTWMQGRRFLEIRGLDLHPDLVIIGHGTNDQFFPADITDEERLPKLVGGRERVLRRASQALANTNLFRLLGPAPVAAPSTESPECMAQTMRYGSCHRASSDQIEAAIHAIAWINFQRGADVLFLNTDFIKTPAAIALRKAAKEVKAPLLDLVGELGRQQAAYEDASALSLGLAARTASPPAASPSLTIPAKQVTLRVQVPEESKPYHVEGSIYLRKNSDFRAELHDDGMGGDERAGDGVFSAAVNIPSDVGAIEYRFFQNDTPEFQPLPPSPSTLGYRILETPRVDYGPVDVFGVSLFMAERAHPNANGHWRIASLIAERLPSLPSFRKRVLNPGPAS